MASESKKRAKTKWVVTTEIQKPDASEIIERALEKILYISKNVKRAKDSDDAPEPRKAQPKTPRF